MASMAPLWGSRPGLTRERSLGALIQAMAEGRYGPQEAPRRDAFWAWGSPGDVAALGGN